MTKLRWVKPKVVVEVSFVEWTRDGALRHSEFVAIRDDKRPSDVHRGSWRADPARSRIRSRSCVQRN